MPKPGPKPRRSPYSLQQCDYTTTYTQEYVKCGKPACPHCTGGARGHGPYWYAYRYSPARKRRLKWYLGKAGPPTVIEPTPGAETATRDAL
jgi:hypothetical protein